MATIFITKDLNFRAKPYCSNLNLHYLNTTYTLFAPSLISSVACLPLSIFDDD